jgi:hypothetical protein
MDGFLLIPMSEIEFRLSITRIMESRQPSHDDQPYRFLVGIAKYLGYYYGERPCSALLILQNVDVCCVSQMTSLSQLKIPRLVNVRGMCLLSIRRYSIIENIPKPIQILHLIYILEAWMFWAFHVQRMDSLGTYSKKSASYGLADSVS